MKQYINFLAISALSFAAVCHQSWAQTSSYGLHGNASPILYSNSLDGDGDKRPTDSGTSSVIAVRSQAAEQAVRPFQTIGTAVTVGIGGIGSDFATPLSRKFNLRAGAQLFGYSTSFQEEGANVDIHMQLRSGHAALDWFPFGGKFRISPLVVFGNNNGIRGSVVVPISLSGGDYVSSQTDPLHGSASIDFRKVSPGLSIGFGNIVQRGSGHFSFPVEAGFYYVGQPRLKVAFTGSACDPTQPLAIGCESVAQDSDFQHDLSAFIARNNRNLSYASFFPIFSVGFSYRFHGHSTAH
jgi:hypothetical protein